MGSPIQLLAKSFARLPALHNALLHIHEDSFRIIYYHIVAEQTPSYYFKLNTTPSVFRDQIRYLKKRFEIISIREALERIQQGDSLKRTLAITTDDGFIENYTTIAPILAEEKVTATFYLISDCIGNQTLMWRNQLIYLQHHADPHSIPQWMDDLAKQYHLPGPSPGETVLNWSYRAWPMRDKDLLASQLWEKAGFMPLTEWLEQVQPYMNVKQIRELSASGFEFGAHTKTHPLCHKLAYEELQEEIIGSIEAIRAKTGIEPISFAYPFGERPKPEWEMKLVKDHSDSLKALLGIENQLENHENPFQWERDSMEKDLDMSIFTYVLSPLRRRYYQKIRNR